MATVVELKDAFERERQSYGNKHQWSEEAKDILTNAVRMVSSLTPKELDDEQYVKKFVAGTLILAYAVQMETGPIVTDSWSSPNYQFCPVSKKDLLAQSLFVQYDSITKDAVIKIGETALTNTRLERPANVYPHNRLPADEGLSNWFFEDVAPNPYWRLERQFHEALELLPSNDEELRYRGGNFTGHMLNNFQYDPGKMIDQDMM
ncbi:MAG: hypothetical protein NTW94_03420 [Legionellales bacterium]|nr:hypothetical protein [Legionellales bacterium]